MTTTRVLVILSLTTTPSFVLVSATSPISYAPARRSRRMVFARARSRLACCTREGFLATPMESWKRRLNSSSVSSRTFCSSSSPFMSRHALAFIVFWGGATAAPPPDPPTGLRRSKPEEGTAAPPPVPPTGLRRSKSFRSYPWLLQGSGTGHELGLDADLLRGEAEALARRSLVHTLHLVHDPAGLHHGDPELGVALALAHARLCGLLGHRLVREDADEDLSAALHAAGEGDAGRLDLAVGDPARLERLEPEIAEGQARSALGLAPHAAALGLAILDALRHQHGVLRLRRRALGGQHLALEDPYLHADGPVRRVRLGEAVVDVGADGVQRHSPVAIPFAARDLRAPQPPGAGDPDAVGAEPQRRGDGLLHGAPEGHALLELEGHVLRHQLRVELGMDDLFDVEVDLLGRAHLDLVLELLHLGALPADDDAGARGEDGDAGAIGRPLDVDSGDAGVIQRGLDEAPDLHVLVKEARVALGGEPPRAPGACGAQPESDRMCLLPHWLPLGGPRRARRRLVGKLDREMAGAVFDEEGSAHGPRRHALHGRPAVGGGLDHAEVVEVPHLVVVLGIRDGRAQHFLDEARGGLRGVGEGGQGLPRRLAPDVLEDEPGLGGGHADVAGGGARLHGVLRISPWARRRPSRPAHAP